MLRLPTPGSRLCDSPTRRELIQIGGISLLGLMLPEIMRREAGASQTDAAASESSGALHRQRETRLRRDRLDRRRAHGPSRPRSILEARSLNDRR